MQTTMQYDHMHHQDHSEEDLNIYPRYTDYYVKFYVRQQDNYENCPLNNQKIL